MLELLLEIGKAVARMLEFIANLALDLICLALGLVAAFSIWRTYSFFSRLGTDASRDHFRSVCVEEFLVLLGDLITLPVLLVVVGTLWRLPQLVWSVSATRKDCSADEYNSEARSVIWIQLFALIADIITLAPLAVCALAVWRWPMLVREHRKRWGDSDSDVFYNPELRANVWMVAGHAVLDLTFVPVLLLCLVTVTRFVHALREIAEVQRGRSTSKLLDTYGVVFVNLGKSIVFDWPHVVLGAVVLLSGWRTGKMIERLRRESDNPHKVARRQFGALMRDLPFLAMFLVVLCTVYRLFNVIIGVRVKMRTVLSERPLARVKHVTVQSPGSGVVVTVTVDKPADLIVDAKHNVRMHALGETLWPTLEKVLGNTTALVASSMLPLKMHPKYMDGSAFVAGETTTTFVLRFPGVKKTTLIKKLDAMVSAGDPHITLHFETDDQRVLLSHAVLTSDVLRSVRTGVDVAGVDEEGVVHHACHAVRAVELANDPKDFHSIFLTLASVEFVSFLKDVAMLVLFCAASLCVWRGVTLWLLLLESKKNFPLRKLRRYFRDADHVVEEWDAELERQWGLTPVYGKPCSRTLTVAPDAQHDKMWEGAVAVAEKQNGELAGELREVGVRRAEAYHTLDLLRQFQRSFALHKTMPREALVDMRNRFEYQFAQGRSRMREAMDTARAHMEGMVADGMRYNPCACGVFKRSMGKNHKIILIVCGEAVFDMLALVSFLIVFASLYRTVPLLRAVRGAYNKRLECLKQLVELFTDIACAIMGILTFVSLYKAIDLVMGVGKALYEHRDLNEARAVVVETFTDTLDRIGRIVTCRFGFWKLIHYGLAIAMYGVVVPIEYFGVLIDNFFSTRFWRTLWSTVLFVTYFFFPVVFVLEILPAARDDANMAYAAGRGITVVLVLLLLVLAKTLWLVSKEDKYTTPRNPSAHVAWNWPNLQVLLNLAVECWQLISFAFFVNIPWPSTADTATSSGSDYALFSFSSSTYDFSFWFAFALLCLWFVVSSAPVVLEDVIHAQPEGSIRNSPFWLMGVQTLSTTFYMTIVVNLLKVLKCDYTADDTRGFLTENTDIECWTGDHRTMAILAMVGLVFYVLTATVSGADFLGRVNSSSECDICFVEVYQMIVNAVRFVLAAVTIFFVDERWVVLIVSLITDTLLAAVTVLWDRLFTGQPCSVWSVGMWRALSFLAAAWAALCSMIAVSVDNPDDSAPAIALVVGWGVLLLFGIFRTRSWKKLDAQSEEVQRLREVRAVLREIDTMLQSNKHARSPKTVGSLQHMPTEIIHDADAEAVHTTTLSKTLPLTKWNNAKHHEWSDRALKATRLSALRELLEALGRAMSLYVLSHKFLARESTWLTQVSHCREASELLRLAHQLRAALVYHDGEFELSDSDSDAPGGGGVVEITAAGDDALVLESLADCSRWMAVDVSVSTVDADYNAEGAFWPARSQFRDMWKVEALRDRERMAYVERYVQVPTHTEHVFFEFFAHGSLGVHVQVVRFSHVQHVPLASFDLTDKSTGEAHYYSVDLTPYRGSAIFLRLRFTDAGVVLDGAEDAAVSSVFVPVSMSGVVVAGMHSHALASKRRDAAEIEAVRVLWRNKALQARTMREAALITSKAPDADAESARSLAALTVDCAPLLDDAMVGGNSGWASWTPTSPSDQWGAWGDGDAQGITMEDMSLSEGTRSSRSGSASSGGVELAPTMVIPAPRMLGDDDASASTGAPAYPSMIPPEVAETAPPAYPSLIPPELGEAEESERIPADDTNDTDDTDDSTTAV